MWQNATSLHWLPNHIVPREGLHPEWQKVRSYQATPEVASVGAARTDRMSGWTRLTCKSPGPAPDLPACTSLGLTGSPTTPQRPFYFHGILGRFVNVGHKPLSASAYVEGQDVAMRV